MSNDQAQPGRVVIFALDAQSIRSGDEKSVMEAATRMLDGLSPADAVGLIEIPGPSQEVTRDRSRIAEALGQFKGRSPGEAEKRAMGKTLELNETDRARDV